MRSLSILPCAMAALLGIHIGAEAAGHPEITVIPLGQAEVKPGAQDVSYRLPSGPTGHLQQPIVILAAQPQSTEEQPSPLAAPDTSSAESVPKRQVPATLRFSIAGQDLPAWKLQPHATAYVIGLEAVTTNPAYAEGRLAMQVTVESPAKGVGLSVIGMPDPMLLGAKQCGPLTDLAEAAGDPEIEAYFAALSEEIAGRKAMAQAGYMRLRLAKNPSVGRFARRGLRMLAYELRKYKLSGNFMEHRRWGLYLQQCGLTSAAFKEFEECRILMPGHSDSAYRAAETLARIGGPYVHGLDYMGLATGAARITNPNDWYALVVILTSRSGKALSAEEIGQIKDRWQWAEAMVAAASGGTLRIVTSFLEVPADEAARYTLGSGGLLIPPDTLVEKHGWFDSVFVVAPRQGKQTAPATRSVGGDRGPNGAALSSLAHDTRDHEYLAALYEHLTWAVQVGEVGSGIPLGDGALGCGHRPVPNTGHAYMGAMRYHFTPAMFRRLKISDMPVPGSHVRLWQIEGPQPVGAQQDGQQPGRHAAQPFVPPDGGSVVRRVSDQDFIDLAELFPNAGCARTRATSWVYAPREQQVRMWLGQNDGIAVWINGRRVHEGRYYSAGKYADTNLVDTVAAYAHLQTGWNEVRVVAESWPPPHDKGWGFSVRFCTWDNRPVPGIAYLNRQPEKDLVPAWTPPKIGEYYTWEAVKHDYDAVLPALTAGDLTQITGIKRIDISGEIAGVGGHFAVIAPGRAVSPSYREPAAPWREGEDRDVLLNNVLDWARESSAALRYQEHGEFRDLLFVKPESIETYVSLLHEPAIAAERFGGRSAGDRILGYVAVPAGSSSRTLFVMDTLLSETSDARWPLDEEDLLSPLGERVPNSALRPPEVPSRPTDMSQ